MGFDEYRPARKEESAPRRSPPAADVKPAEFKDRVLPFAGGSLFTGVACVFLWLNFIHPMFVSQEARSWPTAQATIERSEVKTYQETHTRYGFEVGYHYDFNGKEYHSPPQRVMGGGSSIEAQRLATKYPVGGTVTVYVNPAQPEYVFIDWDAERSVLSWFPLIFVGIGGWTMFRAATAVYIVKGITARGGYSLQFCDSIEEVRKIQERTLEFRERTLE